MSEIIEKEFSRALRYQTDLSCILLDLDYFKSINDTFGHTFGDFVLREMSACLRQYKRKSDISIRYGGEEFLLLLPNTGIAGTRKVAEKIRTACEKKICDNGNHSTTVTVSIGIASVKPHQLVESKELLTYADKALYRSKAEGRNRVTVYMKKPSWMSEDNIICEDKNLQHLKERLSVILEKTKNSSIESLDLLTHDIGGEEHKQHNHDTKRYIKLIGEKLALPPTIIETFNRAANFHDNFKVLLKKTSNARNKILNKEERLEIEDHPYMLSELIELFDFFANEKTILQYHHENFDGTGYPNGLEENEIPLGARIFALTDAIAAMLSKRLYKVKLSPEEMVVELADRAGTQFDPMLVSLFFDIIEKQKLFPVPSEVLEKAREKVREKK
jgi:diguanylate cyclase (GGDEF)-like protein